MAKYTNSATTFDVGNVNFSAGDGYVRCGPETNGEYVCSDIPEDGLVTITGCGGLIECELEINPIPCIDDVKECGPCSDGCSGSGAGSIELTDEQMAQVAESPVVTAVIEQIATDCSAAEIAGASAAKAGG